MDLRAELLKSIWYAFTALDVEKSGKVSKSQLKVSNRGSRGGVRGGLWGSEDALQPVGSCRGSVLGVEGCAVDPRAAPQSSPSVPHLHFKH